MALVFTQAALLNKLGDLKNNNGFMLDCFIENLIKSLGYAILEINKIS